MRTERWLAAAAFVTGTIAWFLYLQHDLVLSHYDAKAHLVVARRVIDNLTPGWQQFGAVWLPLPHLLQVLPTQIDLLYRTGAFGSMLSITAFTVTVWATARLVIAMTGSRLGAATAALILMLNPNLLYLQSTPMTELLLLALTSLGILWMYEWLAPRTDHPSGRAHHLRRSGRDATRLQAVLAGRSVRADRPGGPPKLYAKAEAGPDVQRVPAKLGWVLFAAMWTRYEAWPIVAAALAIAAYATPRFLILRLAAWPLAAALLFIVNSRITVGSWFVSGGFYMHDPLYDGQLWRSLVAVWWGTYQLSGIVSEAVALVTAVTLTFAALRRAPRRAALARLIPVSLFAAAALPFYAFYQGHPFRVRYMVAMVAACAPFCGIAVGQLRRPELRDHEPTAVPRVRLRSSWGLAVLLIGSTLIESPVWGRHAPMIAEALWDAARSRERRAVTACLAPHYRGERVMASMGSLAHYMQELSHEGFAIADFLHEGNGIIWELAMETGPAPHAGWMLVEEQSEGGDLLAQRVRADPAFTRGMARVCEGGGVALYRRE